MEGKSDTNIHDLARVSKAMDIHFQEDREKARLDDIRFAKLTELATINGNHLSYFNKNLLEVKSMLCEQNKATVVQNEVLNKHMERGESMLVNYEENAAFFRGVKKRGGWFVAGAGIIVTISAGWYV